jgi:hypothetical protein
VILLISYQSQNDLPSRFCWNRVVLSTNVRPRMTTMESSIRQHTMLKLSYTISAGAASAAFACTNSVPTLQGSCTPDSGRPFSEGLEDHFVVLVTAVCKDTSVKSQTLSIHYAFGRQLSPIGQGYSVCNRTSDACRLDPTLASMDVVRRIDFLAHADSKAPSL